MKTIRKFALWLGIATTVLAIAAFYLLNGFPTEQRKMSSQQAPTPSHDTSAYVGLLTKARAQGSVRVIVGLKVPFQPEGSLGVQATQTQRNETAQAQTTLLNRMASYKVSSVQPFTYIPYLAMEVDAAGLADLMSNPAVSTIEEARDIPAAF